MLGSFEKKELKSEIDSLKKMKKFIVAAKNLGPNSIIKESDISLKITNSNNGLTADNYYKIIGKTLKIKKEEDENIFFEDLNL
jgi:sialic acid synthase SpsE